MSRIKITGYLTPEDEDADESSRTGLTEEAYDNLGSYSLDDLEGLRVEQA